MNRFAPLVFSRRRSRLGVPVSVAVLWLFTGLFPGLSAAQEGGFGLTPVPFHKVHLRAGAWLDRVAQGRDTILPGLLERFERAGHLSNFEVAAGGSGEHNGDRAADAEVYKWLEAVAATLHTFPDSTLRAPAEAAIAKIAAAQLRDGYLVTWYQVNRPQRTFRELEESLELYSIAQLIEAGLVWAEVTGDSVLLDVGRRAAKLLVKRFGYGKLGDPPGFPAIEGALLKLAEETGEESYLELALFLIEQRGSERRKQLYGSRFQDEQPILTQRLAVGHAARALNLYTAIAEVARMRGYSEYRITAQTVWDDIVRRKMYVTGGVGSRAQTAGFGVEFDLPLDTAFCESCAAVGLARLNQSLFLLTAHAVGAEIVERELYNALPGAVSLDGQRFFHDNPMMSLGGLRRVAELETTCCPTNLARAFAKVGGTAFAYVEGNLYLSQYIASSVVIPFQAGAVRITTETDYPRSGRVLLKFQPERPIDFALHVRIPGWCTEPVTIGPNEVLRDITVTHGADPGTWLKFERHWRRGDSFTIELPMVAKRIAPDSRVRVLRDRVALRRGPEIYALEGTDNGGLVFDRCLPPEAALSAEWREDLLGGVHAIVAEARALRLGPRGLGLEPVSLVAIPYRLWDNRDPGPMSIWLPTVSQLCELPGESGAVHARGVGIQASHLDRHSTLLALVDGVLPRDSSDHLPPRATFEDHRGTDEWVRYDFPEARLLESSAVYWFDEGEEGACSAPASWKLEWLDGDTWREVKLEGGGYGTSLHLSNTIRFQRVVTPSVRLRVQLAPGRSGGIMEWSVSGPTLEGGGRDG